MPIARDTNERTKVIDLRRHEKSLSGRVRCAAHRTARSNDERKKATVLQRKSRSVTNCNVPLCCSRFAVGAIVQSKVHRFLFVIIQNQLVFF